MQNGEWWFLHFQDAGPYGRITHLQPVRWRDGWPVMGNEQEGRGVGEPVLRHAKPGAPGSPPAILPTSDEFDAPGLGLQWQWQANPRQSWYSLSARPGWLRLYPVSGDASNLASLPSLLLQKFPATRFAATAELDCRMLAPGEKAGLAVMGADYSYIAVERGAEGFRVLRATCIDALGSGAEAIEAALPCGADTLRLRVRVGPGGVCEFGIVDKGGMAIPLGGAFAARPGRWIGAKLGLFCVSGAAPDKPGYADFDAFRFEG